MVKPGFVWLSCSKPAEKSCQHVCCSLFPHGKWILLPLVSARVIFCLFSLVKKLNFYLANAALNAVVCLRHCDLHRKKSNENEGLWSSLITSQHCCKTRGSQLVSQKLGALHRHHKSPFNSGTRLSAHQLCPSKIPTWHCEPNGNESIRERAVFL